MPGETFPNNEQNADPVANGWGELEELSRPSAAGDQEETVREEQPVAPEPEPEQNSGEAQVQGVGGGQSESTREDQQTAPETEAKQTPQRDQDQRIGVATLVQAGFGPRHPIVESSFKQARDKLKGTGPERRIEAYLDRLERLIDKHGNRMEQKLWQMSAERVITRKEDITDDYWRSQEQILRDNGQGRTLSN